MSPHLAALLQEQDALLQPYFPAVETYRERSLIFVNNQFQHAVIRTVALVEGRGVDRGALRLADGRVGLRGERRERDGLE